MSTVIANVQLMKVARFYESTIGKKAIMAVTGLILFGFLIAHMLGNLQIFLGPAVMNHYAETLHGNPPLLWTVRTILLVSVLLHIWASVSLSAVKRQARPVGYTNYQPIHSSCASRPIMLSGPLVARLVAFQLQPLETVP